MTPPKIMIDLRGPNLSNELRNVKARFVSSTAPQIGSCSIYSVVTHKTTGFELLGACFDRAGEHLGMCGIFAARGAVQRLIGFRVVHSDCQWPCGVGATASHSHREQQ